MSATTTAATGAEAKRSQGLPYRADIDGLRAVAILVVVLYHANVTVFSGGFVGVDVFFVISGWLITQQLILRSAARGRVPLADFWARRIRRLIPAAFAMVIGVTLLSLVLLSPLDWQLIAERGVASTLYVSNLLSAAHSGDYFSGPLKDSPYLHTWSLALEEQFYLFWPLLVAAVLVVMRWSRAPSFRRRLMIAMSAVFLVSMVINLRQTAAGSPWAFFGLPARAWEFAAAGFLATLFFERGAMPARFAGVTTLLGLAMIATAVVEFDGSTPFPGWAAVLPVTGALLVVLAAHNNGTASSMTKGLRWRPLVAIGLVSYSWYLWHWPLMVIAEATTYKQSVALRLFAAAIALLVAAASYRWIENPVRHSVRLRRSLPLTYAMGAVLTLGALVAGGGLYLYEKHAIQQEPYRDYEAARQSFRDGECSLATSSRGYVYCESGAVDSPTTVMLVGDSHALQWMSAFGAAAAKSNVRVVLREFGNCPSTPISDTARIDSAGPPAGCAQYQRDTDALIDELRPSGVVLADSNGTKDAVFGGDPAQWSRDLRSQTRSLMQRGIPAGLTVDAPSSNDPLLCLARGHTTADCTLDYQDAIRLVRRYALPKTSLASGTGMPTLDVNGQICEGRHSAIKRGGEWVYAASEHLTKAFTKSQENAIQSFLSQLLKTAP